MSLFLYGIKLSCKMLYYFFIVYQDILCLQDWDILIKSDIMQFIQYNANDSDDGVKIKSPYYNHLYLIILHIIEINEHILLWLSLKL